ncbi:DUF624 domain-containing protein [Vagococcus sp. BWB3-3]|uniref:DUF624 domain-containing protein n=1 Tax=Vagococcus allomyrinae TaxID=2794353 RepID=A0A940SUM2_9ENTE|nr:DUF624 domain-containing protein [Vagococcus allomyrinae]
MKSLIESGITEGINKFFFILKLSVYFWGMSLVGVVFLGVGPAFLAIMSIYQEFGWDYKEITWQRLWRRFKDNFVLGNKLLYTYGGVSLFLFLSLYTSSQLTGMIFLMIDFMLVALLLMVLVGAFFAFALVSVYDISFQNLLKLSFILVFKELKATFSIIVFMVLLIVVGYKAPALLFFAGIGIVAFFLSRLGKKLDEGLVFE